MEFPYSVNREIYQEKNVNYKEDKTWPSEHMEDRSLQVFNLILSSELSKRVRYKVEHEKRYSIPRATMYYIFGLLYKHIDDYVFDHFPKVHFPPISMLEK